MASAAWGKRLGLSQLEKRTKNNAGTVFLRVICLPQICEELPHEVDSIGIILSDTSIPHY